MFKIMELMEMPEMTVYWSMVRGGDRARAIDGHWERLVEYMMNNEVDQCRCCGPRKRRGEDYDHVYMWSYRDTCFMYEFKDDDYCKKSVAHYAPNTRISDIVTREDDMTSKELTWWHHSQMGAPAFDRVNGYFPSTDVCPGWYVVLESESKRKLRKRILDKVTGRTYFGRGNGSVQADDDLDYDMLDGFE
ncbi:hypothetical protein SAMD00019534_021590 [Acytostelium subglobosum LB1]|uniref:hypothetical protein n=1 Tax=Acytostelium subglobosum LB1 TaxID=1410327 RepID=UPI000644989E|nr:hypothetical protein SAMD00019534_021590 [Acytostelium subglobosum LB1]GAM18984.1 hypothetical protein SAMD00019534_021590 [Acytostelium subglobosum LB1]|eukprot:XP_012756911.1 hypothetical protein SAMD00019534_021590 [Acytostelium subglobosum LB1]